MAYVSKQPGKTQSINYYRVGEDYYIVDLPGYGYARQSRKQRAGWDRMVRRFLQQRSALTCVFVLLDSNLTLQSIDHEFINWLGENQIPFALIFTKSDKSKPQTVDENLQSIREGLLQDWEYLPEQFLTSSTSGDGIGTVLNYLHTLVEGTKEDEGK